MLMIFPIFEQCKGWTLDPYWMKLFDDCAKGTLPSGVKMGKDTIIINKIPHKLHSDNLENFKLITSLFRSIGHVSDIDSQISRQTNTSNIVTWKDIRSKNFKTSLILQYVIDSSKRYNVPLIKAKELLAHINLGFLLKQIQPDHVTLEDGKIVSIYGITYTNGDFTIQFFEPSIKTTEAPHIDKINQNLERYLKEYKSSLVV